MRKGRMFVPVSCLAIIALFAAGCETMAGSAATGGLLGAGTGALIGGNHHAGEGALIGGLVGIMTGMIVHDIKSRQMKTAQQTAAEVNYAPDQGIKVLGQNAEVTPGQIRPGTTVKSTIQYAVLGGGPSGITIKEVRTLKQNGKVLKEVSSKDVLRTDGTWESALEISFPAKTPPGTYEVSQAIALGDVPQFDKTVSVTVTN